MSDSENNRYWTGNYAMWIIFAGVFTALNVRSCVPHAPPSSAIAVEYSTVYNLKGSTENLFKYDLPDGSTAYVYGDQMTVVPPQKK